jgi:hypothetical protein
MSSDNHQYTTDQTVSRKAHVLKLRAIVPSPPKSGQKVAVRPDEGASEEGCVQEAPPHPALSPKSFAAKRLHCRKVQERKRFEGEGTYRGHANRSAQLLKALAAGSSPPRPEARALPLTNQRHKRALVLTALLCVCGWLTPVGAQEKPKVGMRMELMSIRNRSSGPLPVRIRLEYNLPQVLQGDLVLSIHDALDDIHPTNLMATLRYEGIALSGSDYEFNVILPPLRTGIDQNWAVVGYFVTDTERIPLSSLRDRFDPPEPHDLLITSPTERGTLICSCTSTGQPNDATAARKHLESALALDNYNPGYALWENLDSSRAQIQRTGRTLIHAIGNWPVDQMADDPLSYCAFDIVLLSDGGLSRLSDEQMQGLLKWVRGGGSVCVLPDEPIRAPHLNFLQTLLKESGSHSQLSRDADGRLIVVSDQADPILTSHCGLGRVVLLPVTDSLPTLLTGETLGRVVAFLWKVRRDQPVWRGEHWQSAPLIELLKRRGFIVEADSEGIWLKDPDQARMVPRRHVDGRFYLDEETFSEAMGKVWGLDDRLKPKTEPLLELAEQALLPADVEMVPTSVIVMILAGYILTIGPVDYLVLGWFRRRKYTWIVFPVVTAAFTLLMIAVAYSYLASDDTGGRLVITDLVDDGVPARQTILETLYYSAQAESVTEHKNATIVQADDSFSQLDWMQMNLQQSAPTSTEPLTITGRFPQSYQVSQRVQQWSPVSLRSFSLEPEVTEVPPIDWNDSRLVTTSEGRKELQERLQKLPSGNGITWYGVVLNQTGEFQLQGNLSSALATAANMPNWMRRNPGGPFSRSTLAEAMLSNIPTAKLGSEGIFRLVSQLSPEGASSLEDLAFLDPTDPAQWALIIVQVQREEFFVFRKLYVVNPASADAAP